MKRIVNFFSPIKDDRADSEMSSLGFDILIFSSISDVKEDEWNQIVPEEKVLMRRPYLKAIEDSSNVHEKRRYALICKNKIPVAAAVFSIVLLSGRDYRSQAEADILARLKSIKDKAKLRVLVCGHTHISGDHGFIYSPLLSHNEAYRALAHVCNKISQSESESCIDLHLIKDFYEEELLASDFLSSLKYRRFKVDPTMILQIRPDWLSFDSYLNDMTSKYRKQALSISKRGAAIERRMLAAAEIEENFDRIQSLYLNVTNKAKVRINHFDTSYLIQAKFHLKEKFQLIAYYLGEEMVGFNTIILWGDNCEAHVIGIDYDRNAEFALYQNMLYDDVRMAIDARKKTLILGRTAMEIKSNIGAKPSELYCYVRHTGPLLNRALKPLFNSIKSTEWIQRNPFKEIEKVEAKNN